MVESLNKAPLPSSQFDAFSGCILGALIGDASGTYLEFSQQLID